VDLRYVLVQYAAVCHRRLCAFA